jgi:N-acetylneuraminic acid mutarotase
LVTACGGSSSGPDGPPCLCDAPWLDGQPPRWSPRAPIPAPIQETAAVALDGRLYVLGGFEGLSLTDKAQIYDVAGDRWSLAPALPAEVHHANAAVVGETIFVVGDLQTFGFTAVGDVWTYNPSTDTAWSARSPMPRPRGAAVTGVIGGKIYVAGGSAGGAVAHVDEYDPAMNTWTPKLAMPAPRDHACGGVIGGMLYVAGGRAGSPDAPQPDVYAYDPAMNTWTPKAPMLTARGGTACGVIDGKLIVVGGEGNAADPSGVFSETEAYDPATDTWTTLEPMSHPRHGMAAAVVTGQLFVPGGADVGLFGAVATHDVFTP